MHFLVWSLKGLQVRVAVVIEIANDDDRITGKWATSSCFCPGSFEDPHRFSRGDVGVIRSPEALADSGVYFVCNAHLRYIVHASMNARGKQENEQNN